MSDDFFATDFKVEIDGAALAPELARHVIELEVHSRPSTIDQFALTLANPFPELRWTHTDDADTFAEGASITIAMGYVDRTQVVFDGEITLVAPLFPESGPATVRVEGLSRLHWLDRGTKLRTFQDVTDSQIVEQIANEAQLTPKGDATQTRHPYVIQRNQTDLDFVRGRSRALRYELLVEGRELIFRKPLNGEAKRVSLVWGDPQEAFAGDDALPLRSFAPTISARRAATAVTVRGQDAVTGDPIEERAAGGDEDAGMGDQTAADLAAGAFGDAEHVVTDPPVSSREEAAERALAEFNRRSLRLVTGRGVSIGVPELRAGSVVDLAGIGRFSGTYYLTSTTQRLGANGYETRFEVERSAFG